MICKCSRSLSELSFHFLDLSLARTSSKMLNRSNEHKHCCLVPGLNRYNFSLLLFKYNVSWGFPVVLVAKYLPANAGDRRDLGLIPGSGRSCGGGHDNLLQYSCLENPTD